MVPLIFPTFPTLQTLHLSEATSNQQPTTNNLNFEQSWFHLAPKPLNRKGRLPQPFVRHRPSMCNEPHNGPWRRWLDPFVEPWNLDLFLFSDGLPLYLYFMAWGETVTYVPIVRSHRKVLIVTSHSLSYDSYTCLRLMTPLNILSLLERGNDIKTLRSC